MLAVNGNVKRTELAASIGDVGANVTGQIAPTGLFYIISIVAAWCDGPRVPLFPSSIFRARALELAENMFICPAGVGGWVGVA